MRLRPTASGRLPDALHPGKGGQNHGEKRAFPQGFVPPFLSRKLKTRWPFVSLLAHTVTLQSASPIAMRGSRAVTALVRVWGAQPQAPVQHLPKH